MKHFNADNFYLGLSLMILVFFLLLLSSGCISFGSGAGETVTERVKQRCAEVGGEWTSFGCVFTVSERDCLEAGGERYFGTEVCTVSVGEEE